jgi:ABC-type ATPase with predicted acetyltransferase domain
MEAGENSSQNRHFRAKQRNTHFRREAIMERWWCVDCRASVELNMHGRCASCDSEAVDSMERAGLKTASASVILTPVPTIPQYAGTI